MSEQRQDQATEARPLTLELDDNRLVGRLYGEHNRHLARIEQRLGVTLSTRGNVIAIGGTPALQQTTRAVLTGLYRRLKGGQEIDDSAVDGALRMAEGARPAEGEQLDFDIPDLVLRGRRRVVTPRSPNQAHYMRCLAGHDLVFGLGPAGTGKTYLAVAVAVAMLLEGRVERIVLSRPAVEAGERLGFLPGDMREKIDPYLRPLYDALHDMLPADQVQKRIERGEIEIAPLAFMRGRTLSNAFVIADEAQNTTPMQMKMLLTRMGEGSRTVVTGDPSQIDLPTSQRSGLVEAVELLAGVPGIAFVRFTAADVVRHPLVARVIEAYAERGDAAKPGT
ncbi:MAG: PhoH family protein [Alphaproteobacteria bacterium]|nr:PhoH family protein [Alphaproteobacteria bacterium]